MLKSKRKTRRAVNSSFCHDKRATTRLAAPKSPFELPPTSCSNFVVPRHGIYQNSGVHTFVARHLKIIEMTGVLMRIFSFSLVSWLGPNSPFMFVWIFNTTDAVMLTWCSTIKRDTAYLVLNAFWIIVGIVGILRAGNILH
jgi:hypothetical protein